MKVFLPLRRATLLIPSGPATDPDRLHLFILLTNAQPDDSMLLVSVSTVQANLPHDQTCLLYRGDHPFIRRDSFVVYSKARIELRAKLIRGVNSGFFESRESLDEAIFARVCHGVASSRFTPQGIKDFFSAAK